MPSVLSAVNSYRLQLIPKLQAAHFKCSMLLFDQDELRVQSLITLSPQGVDIFSLIAPSAREIGVTHLPCCVHVQ